MDQWEKWRKLIHESIESFENSRMQYSTYKRLIRKGEQGPAPGPQSHHANCDICGKFCLSLAGLKSHLRKCAKSILHLNNVTASKTERLCQFCGKIRRRLAGLRSHLRTHRIKGGSRGGRRGHETKEVVALETERTAIIYIYIYIYIYILFTNPSARAGYDTRSIFKRSLTGLNSEFSS